MSHGVFGDECEVCDAALEQIARDAIARVTQMKTAAPGESGAAAEAPDCEGVDAMSIQHHEEATVLGTACIQRPLGGRPEFKGINDRPDGAVATIVDGDLTLRFDDPALLRRWAAETTRAAEQLERHIAKLEARP